MPKKPRRRPGGPAGRTCQIYKGDRLYMLRRAPAGRLLRRGRGQTREVAKGRRCWCGGHRDRRTFFFFRGLPARGEAWGKVPLWGRGWTLGADGSAALPDTACLGGETVGLGADAVLPFRIRPAWAGRQLGREQMAALPFRTLPAWAGRRPGRERVAALPLWTRPAWAGRQSGWERMQCCPSGHGPPGRGRWPGGERAGPFRGRRGGLFPWGRLRSGQESL